MQNKELTVQRLVDYLIGAKNIDGKWKVKLTSDSGVDQCSEGEIIIEDVYVNELTQTLNIYANIREVEDESECDNE